MVTRRAPGAAPAPRGERWGVLGGTFDPVHIGHLAAAVAARHALALDRVLLVPAGDPWQKRGAVVAPAAARYEMAAAAASELEGVEPCRIEIDRAGPTYTIDTVEALAAPDRSLFLVVGADVVPRLGTWHRADDLRAAVTLAVVDREGEAAAEVPEGWTVEHVSMPRLDVSSTALRARVAEGRPIDVLVPAPAARIIRDLGLYTAPR